MPYFVLKLLHYIIEFVLTFGVWVLSHYYNF